MEKPYRLGLPKCRHLLCWNVPFTMLYSTPFVLIFSYYNSQNQLPFKLWNVRLLARDYLIGSALFVTYVTLRTLALDPYCDPNSLQYDANMNPFERKKKVMEEMKGILKAEGKD
mmetsp:Transcript_703/g.1349  ORF Transcript_703/g.1349 Transcript_703/m.1349 type:complete len:114 (-) Transcript_703:39-380(-)